MEEPRMKAKHSLVPVIVAKAASTTPPGRLRTADSPRSSAGSVAT